MYYMYVIYSKKLDMYYNGSTGDLRTRFFEHKSGKSRFTQITNDWKLLYYEAFTKRNLAYRREMSLKKRSKSWKELLKRILEDKR